MLLKVEDVQWLPDIKVREVVLVFLNHLEPSSCLNFGETGKGCDNPRPRTEPLWSPCCGVWSMSVMQYGRSANVSVSSSVERVFDVECLETSLHLSEFREGHKKGTRTRSGLVTRSFLKCSAESHCIVVLQWFGYSDSGYSYTLNIQFFFYCDFTCFLLLYRWMTPQLKAHFVVSCHSPHNVVKHLAPRRDKWRFVVSGLQLVLLRICPYEARCFRRLSLMRARERMDLSDVRPHGRAYGRAWWLEFLESACGQLPSCKTRVA